MPRYALYYIPKVSDPLYQIACSWLGRDPVTGRDVSRSITVAGFSDQDLNDLTSSARRYGFHATLKAPFELADGKSLADLEQALDVFVAHHAPVSLPALQVDELSQFLALRPCIACPELMDFTANLVREFDHFRAPISEQDVARRNPASLSERQRSNLLQWGYPHIFEDFRFHMTLTDGLSDEQRDVLLPALRNLFGPALTTAPQLSSIALFVEPEQGAPFTCHRQFELTGSSKDGANAASCQELGL